jgi:hypothetical protein
MLKCGQQTSCTITKIFSDFVAAKGLHMSRQRILVLEAFQSAGEQSSIEELFTILRENHPAFPPYESSGQLTVSIYGALNST